MNINEINTEIININIMIEVKVVNEVEAVKINILILVIHNNITIKVGNNIIILIKTIHKDIDQDQKIEDLDPEATIKKELMFTRMKMKNRISI